MTPTTFDPTGPLPTGRTSLQASAGTGKTWTIAALATRYVAEGVATLDELLVVTFTRAATAELRHRIRERLTDGVRHLRATLAARHDGTLLPATDDPILALLADPAVADNELARRLSRLRDALAGIDRGLISTIHGFAHQVLRSAGHLGDIDGHLQLVEDVDDLMVSTGRDLLVSLYADEPDDEVLAARPSGDLVTKLTVQRLRHPHAALSPLAADDSAGVPERARELARMADLVADDIAAGKRRRGIMTFDDLLHQLAAALRDPAVRDLVLATFRRRFRIALVDEAQDTDPVQWEIIEALFAGRTLVVIGDPKQAIYRFRGADVHAYVRAVGDGATTRYGLGTNHRSDRRLVAGVNALFRDTSFGHPDITHVSVGAAHDRRLHLPGDDAPLHLRLVRSADGDLRAGATRRRIATDLADRITRLLTSSATIRQDDGDRPVTPGDLAVLVRAHATVDDVTAALGDAGVPFVVTAVGSVFETPAALQWRTLLVTLQRPSSTSALRALASSDFVGWDATRLARGSTADLEELAGMAHRWQRVLLADGVASLLRTIHDDTGLGPRLLGRAGGERLLTDVEHVGELLHRSDATARGPSAMRDWLDQQTQRVTTDDVPAEERSRRLESDRDAVTIMTVHASKGLEFPVVYLPYMMWNLSAPSVPFTTTGDRPTLELGGPDKQQHQAEAKEDEAGEALRLAYVAMTRARHRVEAWWWQARGYESMPLSKLMLRGAPQAPVSAEGRSDDASRLDAGMADLRDHSHGAVSWAEVSEHPEPATWTPPPRAVEDVAAAHFQRTIDRRWTRTSYTALTTPLARFAPDHDDAGGGLAALREDDDAPGSDVPGRAGTGEQVEDDPGQPLPLGGLAGGARIGTLVHDLYEHVDFTTDDVAERIRERLELLVPDPDTLGLATADVAAGIVATLDTPLGPGFGELRLREVAPADRLDELAFELPLATAPGQVGVDVAGIRDVFATLPDDDPLADYVERLDDPALARTVRGYLTGFVDLVLRRRTDDGEVFHVVDYKTNVLFRRDEEPTTRHYRPEALVGAMHHGHYPLQAALYAVALHRYLRWRLPDYDPDRHLGTIGYLFVRGMVGPTTPRHGDHPCGVMAWHPPSSFVVALSDHLHAGRAAA